MVFYTEAGMIKGYLGAQISFMFYRLYDLIGNSNCIISCQELTAKIVCLDYILIDALEIFKIKV